MLAHSGRRGICLAIGAVAVVVSGGAHAKVYDEWQTAAPVVPVNSPQTEGCPIESPDGLHLFIMSTRGAGGDQDMWVASRTALGAPWGTPVELPAPINSDANDFCPTPLRGKGLLFVSTRGGTDAYGTEACGEGDIYFSRFSPAKRTWKAPRNLGCVEDGGPNGPGTEFGPSLVKTEAGTQLYFSSGGALGTGTQDIYVSRRKEDGSFGPRQAVAALNSNRDDVMPNVRKDGLEVVLASTRDGSAGFDIWSSTRASVGDPWSPPVNLGPAINGPGAETRPSLSWDGRRLYFGSSGEIFVSQR